MHAMCLYQNLNRKIFYANFYNASKISSFEQQNRINRKINSELEKNLFINIIKQF